VNNSESEIFITCVWSSLHRRSVPRGRRGQS